MPSSSARALLLAFAVLALAALCDAKHCRRMARNTWEHDKGSFEKEGAEWIEYNDQRETVAKFMQTMDNGNQVVLHDRKRQLSIVLQDGIAGVNNDGGSQYQQLYKGHFAQGFDCS
eukprot:NODE_4533_length_573_cov_69.646947_g3292_i0.p2 GENE.NODE_4533_length_573_cov_69.646947_g3292_i0~~NODE_4533_length_573_cov_69.646947_g3292_i0.p2  ORF type:complete len:116 (+),score=43.15 NODE_4533_length_573_cov_69.646947_g3292_i0:152-499(+)